MNYLNRRMPGTASAMPVGSQVVEIRQEMGGLT